MLNIELIDFIEFIDFIDYFIDFIDFMLYYEKLNNIHCYILYSYSSLDKFSIMMGKVSIIGKLWWWCYYYYY